MIEILRTWRDQADDFIQPKGYIRKLNNTAYFRIFQRIEPIIFDGNKLQLFIGVYPFMFTGEELRYGCRPPHADWKRNPEPSGSKRITEDPKTKDRVKRMSSS